MFQTLHEVRKINEYIRIWYLQYNGIVIFRRSGGVSSLSKASLDSKRNFDFSSRIHPASIPKPQLLITSVVNRPNSLAIEFQMKVNVCKQSICNHEKISFNFYCQYENIYAWILNGFSSSQFLSKSANRSSTLLLIRGDI